jgi:hypothetical protein
MVQVFYILCFLCTGTTACDVMLKNSGAYERACSCLLHTHRQPCEDLLAICGENIEVAGVGFERVEKSWPPSCSFWFFFGEREERKIYTEGNSLCHRAIYTSLRAYELHVIGWKVQELQNHSREGILL